MSRTRSFLARPHAVIGAFLALAVLAVVAFALLAGGGTKNATAATERSTTTGPATTGTSLPREVGETLALIRAGGPFPYRRDGVVFENREGRLPRKARGYYHEYTVPTPGSHDRGARRIITGTVEEFWYTPDHYRTFRRLT